MLGSLGKTRTFYRQNDVKKIRKIQTILIKLIRIYLQEKIKLFVKNS